MINVWLVINQDKIKLLIIENWLEMDGVGVSHLLSVTEISIQHLPWEVLQEIFSYLNGNTLMIAKRVCSYWRDHINYLENDISFWYDRCQKEIPVSVRLDLLDNAFACHWQGQQYINWKVIYKCWYNWDIIQDKTVSVNRYISELNGISAIKVSGEWLLVSTCDGGGRLYAKNFHKPGLIDLFGTTGPILNFELVHSDNKETSGAVPYRELEKVFDSLEHNEIWLEMKDFYVQLGRNYCRHVDKINQRIRHSQGYEVRINHSQSVLLLKKICSKASGPTNMQVHLSGENPEIFDFWANKVSISTEGDDKCSKIIDTRTIDFNSQKWENIERSSLPYTCKYFTRFYSWHGSLFVSFVANQNKKNLVFHTAFKTVEQCIPVTEGGVTAVLFHCGYLFLGTIRGYLLIYRVNSPEKCLSVTVYESEAWAVYVGFTVVHIAVVEPTHHSGTRPMIVCASSEHVNLISFA